MRSVLIVAIAGLLMCAGSPPTASAGAKPAPKAPAADSARARALREGWPDTKAGLRASQWVEAFSAGEDAMRAFLKECMSDSCLARRGVEKRIENYRKLHERFGSLVLTSVDESKPSELKATLLAGDASTHKFGFAVEAKAPHKLISVSMYEQGHGGHSGGHH